MSSGGGGGGGGGGGSKSGNDLRRRGTRRTACLAAAAPGFAAMHFDETKDGVRESRAHTCHLSAWPMRRTRREGGTCGKYKWESRLRMRRGKRERASVTSARSSWEYVRIMSKVNEEEDHEPSE